MAPEDDFGFVDFEAVIVIRRETRHGPDRAVDVACDAAGSADQVMMVVTHTSLEPGRGSGRLDAADEVLVDQNAKCVVHRLARDRPEQRADVFGQLVGRRVGAGRHSPQDGRAPRRRVVGGYASVLTAHAADQEPKRRGPAAR